MIAAAKADLIDELAKGGGSIREIARLAGASRGTVSAVLAGRHACRRPARKINETPRPRGPFVRCPGCGGKVQQPCLYCWLERQDLRHVRAADRRS